MHNQRGGRLLDAGNTRIKWALVRGDAWLVDGAVETANPERIADAWGLSGGVQRGTALVRMTPPGFAVDTAWTSYATEYGPQFGGFAYQTDSHIYVCRGQKGWLETQLRRFDKTSGQEDPNWSSDETYLCNADYERRADGSTLVFPSALYGSAYYQSLTRFHPTARNTPTTVVEYYSRDAKRFFITARASEIAQLDDLPASFSRTGMQFAATTALVRDSSDSLTAPVCRFYAAPDAGGSNTHFYGRDSDCTMLKRFAILRYEGYDFRAGVPTGAGDCPAALPTPVYRLFNQQSASNNGNHRYVVSDARRNEMKAAGWADEGIAFCTSSATDSKPLPAIAP